MPRTRPATTGYERLAQADQFSDDSDTDALDYSVASLQPTSAPRYAPITQPRPHSGMTSPKMSGTSGFGGSSHGRKGGSRGPRQRSNSGVDLKAINARLERWADEIASKFKRGKKKGGEEDEQLEIHHTVFQAPEGVRPVTAEMLSRPEPGYMTKAEFEAIVDSVRLAIQQGMHPRMISQGSSGSYFARNTEGKVVGVFKPKDEEPYAAGNPKWNKWIHRNLFPCCFGRACLIPNLSYVSEAAAYVLDAQLRTHMVPYTDVVYLSSKSFHYPFWDRYSYSRNKKTLPAKPGSFQVFLKGFKDANLFLREHPWPDQYLSGFRTNDPHRKKKKRWVDSCRPGSSPAGEGDSDDEDGSSASLTPGPGNFVWTPTLKQAFREELEKLVILDYIMRNTDRGLDNWMIKVDWETQEVSIVSEPLHLNTNTEEREDDDDDAADQGPRPVDLNQRGPPKTRASYPYRTQKPMDASTSTGATNHDPKITIGAIDNSLSWPWKHPDAWRSFPFGWLFLPVDLIGRPFSQKTRDHFLPLLTSTAWWSQTQLALRRVFQIDPDFQERMFAKQIAVMKGQAWNVVETLKTPDHGPLELTRRAKVCVWDDLVDVPVAVPMRAPSAEMRRQAAAAAAADREQHQGTTDYFTTRQRPMSIDEEEMDIGFAGSSSKPAVADLLGLGSSSNNSDLPHPGRFEIASPAATDNDYPQSLPEGHISPPNGSTGVIDHPLASPPRRSESDNTTTTRKHHPPSLRPPATNGLNMYNPDRDGSTGQAGYHERRFSFATPASRKVGNTIASQMYSTSYSHNGHAREWSLEGAGEGVFGAYVNVNGGDVDELDAGGDLGYAAAEGMEGNQRKVIVERLEAVKSRNPVFTWC